MLLLTHADNLLRGRGPFGPDSARLPPAWVLPAIILVFAPVYGAVMGTYAFDSAERLLQVLYSAIKLPLLLAATTALCLPGFFVVTTILGLRDDFAASLRAILAGQAGMAVTLAALAPITRFYYFSIGSYAGAQLFNGLMFAMATLAAQLVTRRGYRVLIARNPYHRVAFVLWAALYVFVGIQMAWTLRPFIGSPGAFPTFFRDEPFTNAYVVIAQILSRVF